jgi:hypothetical protein
MPQCVHCRGSWRHCSRAMNALPANKVSCQWIATVEPFLSCLRSVWIHMYTNRNVRSLHDNGGRAPFSIRSPACSRHVLYGFTSSALRKNKGSKGSWTYQAPLVEARAKHGRDREDGPLLATVGNWKPYLYFGVQWSTGCGGQEDRRWVGSSHRLGQDRCWGQRGVILKIGAQTHPSLYLIQTSSSYLTIFSLKKSYICIWEENLIEYLFSGNKESLML